MLLEGPPLKVVAEELSFLADNKITSMSGSAKIENSQEEKDYWK